jgi:hypothetical protein
MYISDAPDKITANKIRKDRALHDCIVAEFQRCFYQSYTAVSNKRETLFSYDARVLRMARAGKIKPQLINQSKRAFLARVRKE